MKRYSLWTLEVLLAMLYLLRSWYRRWGTQGREAVEPLPGDSIVTNPEIEYTLANSIAAPASAVWPWLVQMGRGRAGFYTYEWVENVFGADIHNAEEILPDAPSSRASFSRGLELE